ncbi:hypothetical protein GGR26_002469 [Lewinella marina]|uniref:VWA domain-containing protein n=1 Tax=Neolewinella marina TaxID=438751 RepID=A0A2G0CBY1_9BACT|nr:hypothetical protein [Neolewinella marina]NJB86692.1 hypothetical protein [Neolewinella marina]PHK97499.1 hypothetical protein CGL56_15485 [Neolewinella marina]
MENISFTYPLWYLLLCGLAGLVVALLLYYRSAITASRPLLWGMAALRFLGYTLLAVLLLAPLLRFLQTDRQEPIIVLAQDVSESVGLETDTTAYRAEWAALREALARDHRVVHYTFGSTVREEDELSFSDKQTNLDAVLSEIADLYGNQNLGAVVLATDGIYNQGPNPAYRDLPLRAPVYTVGLGDTTRRRDLYINRVFHNRIAYLEDKFVIQVDLSARNAAGERTALTVSRVGEAGTSVLHTESLTIDGPDFFTTREVVLDADRAGVQRYRIAVSTIGQEVTTANNQRDIFVDVLDGRQSILLLAAAPHPDLGALRQALVSGRNNEVEIAYGNKFDGRLSDYDLVVLHHLPSAVQRVSRQLEELRAGNIPTLFITGPDLPAPLVNAAQELLQLSGGGAQVQGNEVTARLAPGFSAFTLSEELRQALPTYPPLSAPFGEFRVGPGANPVLLQRIGRVDTEYPLLVVGESRGRRTGVLAASGLWQWRLYDYLEYGNHARFDELVSQLAQFLTVQEDKRRFRVSVAENIFDENEPVILDGELYNTSYELVNDPEARVVITGPEDREYNYTFTRTANAYALNAGTLPVGNYRYRATAAHNGEELVSEGRFSVQAVEVERYALEADHGLLRQLSERYGGSLLFPGQLAALADFLAQSEAVKPVLYQTVTTRSVLNVKWIFFLLFGLFVAEWGLRRWSGGY